IYDYKGEVTSASVIARDTTARKRAEIELGRQRDYAATILASMHEGFLLSRDGVILDVNQALCELTGFSRDELLGARVPFPFWAAEAVEDVQRQPQRLAARRGGD